MKSSVFILTYEIYASCFSIIIMKMCHATLYNCMEKIDKNDRKNEYIKEKKKHRSYNKKKNNNYKSIIKKIIQISLNDKKKENNFARLQPLISFNGSQLIGLCRVFYQTSYSEEYTVYCIYDIFNFRKRYVIFWPLCLRFIYYYSQLAISGSLSKYNVSNVYGDKNISGRLKCMSLSTMLEIYFFRK